jgi:hypothetical protein
MKEMHARPGDHLVIRSNNVGRPDREAEVLEVRGAEGQPPFVVRWADDGRVGYVLPGSDAFVERSGDGTDA